MLHIALVVSVIELAYRQVMEFQTIYFTCTCIFFLYVGA